MVTLTRKRFTIDEYHRLAELGFLTENDRVELICGEIIQMAAKGKPHSVCNTLLFQELVILLAGRAIIRGQEPITLPPDSEPEPDVVIAHSKPDFYLSGHPSPSDILVVIEVSDSTFKYDQEIKLTLYAEASISNYWILNLVDTHLEAYSEPYQDISGKFGYRNKKIFLPNEVVKIPNFPDLFLQLNKVFPPQPYQ